MVVVLSAASALPFAGCSVDAAVIGRELTPADHGYGGEVEEPEDDGGKRCDRRFEGRIRDFKSVGNGGHPDFEAFTGERFARRIVLPELGPDKKPVYNPSGPAGRTTGAAAFDQWFRDEPGVNIPIPFTVPMNVSDRGTGIFLQAEFFPIDDQGWGNEGRDHNYGFTYELHTTFEYMGGDYLVYASDDDLWVFINGRLAVDLGGVHQPAGDIFVLDGHAEKLGIEVGNEYPLDIFHAERSSSNESSLSFTRFYSFTNCDPIVLP
ncbi:fibro-slime domain-containing protein [Sorangium sp. So ce260]|uniref:fibro-slime domain-containing protein n=1 Tax=Sorangium sp. So ce260 TaxID=3133291 RepID=UPI003F61F08D